MKSVVAVLVLVVVVAVADVVRFESRDTDLEDDYDVLKVLVKPRIPERYRDETYFKKLGISKTNRVKSFVWKSCESQKKTTALIINFSLTPDPVSIPGTITLAFSVNNMAKIDSPFKVAVQIKKKMMGSWVSIPCIEQFGSCNYDDFCQILDMIVYCPDPFTQHGIPCQCPFNVGKYVLPATDFEVNVQIPLASGDYFGVFNATDNSNFSACYEMYVSMVE